MTQSAVGISVSNSVHLINPRMKALGGFSKRRGSLGIKVGGVISLFILDDDYELMDGVNCAFSAETRQTILTRYQMSITIILNLEMRSRHWC